MNLTDRCRRDRLVGELREDLPDPTPEVGFDDLPRQSWVHWGGVGLESSERALVRRQRVHPDRAGFDHGEHLTGLHQHTLGMPKQLRVTLGGPFVKPLHCARVAGPFLQCRDHAPAGGASGEARQRHRAANPALGH